ncbi:MAG TPA: hypothetical protein VMW27_05210 [Thermoanaerobaculia bacterium]|nr:hypothetical protein [Thermoanaerobaculia bacterium]
MKKQMGLAALLMLMVCLFAQAAAAVPVPVKGVTNARGSVELLVTFYDRADGGKELHAATQTLPVIDGVYFGMVEVPDTVFRKRDKVYISVANPQAPAIALSERGQFTIRRDDKAVSIVGCSLCFTCGASFTVFQGSFTAVGSTAVERGAACSGAVTTRSDPSPFLCCQ